MAADLVLTAASTILCSHTVPVVPAPPVPPPPVGGGRIAVPGAGALLVNGQPVLPALPPAVTITGACAVPVNPPTSNPCIPPGAPSAPATITAGAAARLRVGGVPVLLAGTFAAVTGGVPPAAFAVHAGHRTLLAE